MADTNIGASRTIKGVMWDLHPMLLGEGAYQYAMNARIEGADGGTLMVQNEPSNLLCTEFPEGFFVTGFINIIEQQRVIWFLANDDGDSEIGETNGTNECRQYARDGVLKGACDDCASVKLLEDKPLETLEQIACCGYRRLANDECLAFSRLYPINGVEYRLTDCGIEIFFTDDNNGRRYLLLDYENGSSGDNLIIKKEFYIITGFITDDNPDCQVPIYGTDLDCNKLNIQPNINTVCIEFIDLVTGGSNRAGVYQFFVAYADESGNKLSSWVSSTNPIPIRTKDITFETNYLTDRAIRLEISNLDSFGAYQFYKLAVAKTIDNQTSFFEVGTFPVTQHSYTYTGNNEAEPRIDVREIFQRVPFYKTARNITSSNKILFWANLKEFPKLNLQRVANNIVLQWQTIAIPETVYRNPRNANKFRGLMRDEVYPAGIQFIFENGQESSILHIPGREAEESDLEPVENADSVREKNCLPCADTEEPEEQLIIESINTTSCSGSSEPLVLVTDNSFQSSGCSLEEHTGVGCTPAVVDGTPPYVSAGVDQTVNYVPIIALNGTAVQGTSEIVSISWTQLSGPNTVTIGNSALLNTYFENYNSGIYEFQFCAEDAQGNVSVDTVQFNITIPANNAPVADPGPDKIVTLPTSSSYLNASASSDEDGIGGLVWVQLDGPNTATITDNASSYTTVTGLIEGVYEFGLIVEDPRGCVSTATTKIYVIADPSTEVPGCAELLFPANGSKTSASSTVVLDWEDISAATSYDVYLRADAGVFTLIGNTTDSNFTVEDLDSNTIYHWYVVPKNDAGSASGCAACYHSFVTPVQQAVPSCEKARWEVYNTASIDGGDLALYQECEETCYQYGSFAYWESTEKYPNDPIVWGELCGKPIRHHKVPDSFITHIHDNQNGELDYNRNNVVYPIGFKVDHDSIRAAIAEAVVDEIITQDDADRIVGYRIFRGNRYNNKSVQAKGILYDVNQYRRKIRSEYFDNQNIYFANYPFNDVRSNPFITDDFRNYENHNTQKGADLPFIFSKRYTFHSPDTHFTEPTIGSKLKLETVEYGMSEGYFTKSKKQAKQRFLSNAAYSIAFTAGIVAALLRTEEKEVREYSVKGNVISALGVASGTWGPYLPYLAGPGGATSGESGLDFSVNPTKSGSIFASTDATTRTIQGKYQDWFNPFYIAAKKPVLLPLLPFMIANYLTDFLTKVIQEAGIVIDLMESFTPYRDWTAQYHSVGKYNSYKPVPNTGNKIRSIISSWYLDGVNEFINEPSETDPNQVTSIKMNNWNRESSLYLKYEGDQLPNASDFSGVEDQSRFTLEDSDVNCDFDKRVYKPISSYYAAIKNYVPDQYGSIFNIEYLPTDSCMFGIDASNGDCKTVFGGDTFIDRFALKIKVPYFLATTFGFPAGTDFNFSEYANLGVPRHYYNSTLGIASEFDDIGDILSLFTPEGVATFLGRPKSIRDCSTSKFFYQNGYIYLYHYGIPYFLVESDVNVAYRHGENMKEKAFFPAQSDLDFWLQEENVPISEDNYYFYNNSYSKQNKETPFVIDGPTFEPDKDCQIEHPNRIIYSNGNNWLVYKANDYYDFPLSKGKITSIEGIENETVLVRTTNSTSVFKSVLRTMVDGQTVQTGNGGLFSNPPQEFAETTLGYVGSQHQAILHTEYGHIFVDAKRGQIFSIGAGGSSLDPLSNKGMDTWFKENLPFQILRDFPNMTEDFIDNNLFGVGITMSFDKKNSRFFITKRDFKLIDSDVHYHPNLRGFSKSEAPVTLGDKRYFKDRSWTWCYNFKSQSWVSPFTWNPNYYIDFVDHFGSGKDSGFWLHDLTNSSFQVFYGKLEPFTFEPIAKFDVMLKALQSIEFDTEVRRYSNEFDYVLKSNVPGVNKAVVYNDHYNSGLLKLVKKNPKKMSLKYPVRNFDNWEIEVALAGFKWRFNQFFDLARKNSEVPFWKYKANNIEKSLNPQALNYKQSGFDMARMKGQWFKIMLSNDSVSNYKIIHKITLDKQTTEHK